MTLTVKEIVANNQRVTFVRYYQGNLWYVSDNGFSFPIPISDTGAAEFPASDKALLYMRWIRAHLNDIEAGKLA